MRGRNRTPAGGRARTGGPRLGLAVLLLSCAGFGPSPPDLLRRVNTEVNRSIRYEREPPGQDVVRFGPERGDCEDYAETKRLRLIAAGWPRRALRVNSVRMRSGECHAVLVATDADGRRWVLDNQVSGIETIEQTGRRYAWSNCDGRDRGH